MADLQTWENLPMSQSDGRTIAEYIADQIALHNDDAESHTGNNQSLGVHRTNGVIDHPEFSLVPDKVALDPIEFSYVLGYKYSLGELWDVVPNMPNTSWSDICFGDGIFIAVRGSSSVREYYTSEDGLTWNIEQMPVDQALDKIDYKDGRYVGWGWDDGTRCMYYSDDALSWTKVAVSSSFPGGVINHNDTYFVSYRYDGSSQKFIRSTDGESWDDFSVPTTASFTTPMYFDGNWYSINTTHTNIQSIYRSSNFSSWSQVGPTYFGHPVPLGVHNGLLYMGYNDEPESFISRSGDGTSWTDTSIASIVSPAHAVSTPIGFVAVANQDYTSGCMLMSPGPSWQLIDMPATHDYIKIAYGNGVLVAISWDTGTDTMVRSGAFKGGIV